MDKYTVLVIFFIAGLLSVYFLLRFQIMELEREILEIKYFLGIERPPQTQPTVSELLKISSIYIDNSTHAIIEIRNAEKTEATIDHILINGKLNATDNKGTHNYAWTCLVEGHTRFTLSPGEWGTIIIEATDWDDINSFTGGVVYDFAIVTTTGGSYPASAQAP
jgi:hypothetical protein